jgi:hypothetical protein
VHGVVGTGCGRRRVPAGLASGPAYLAPLVVCVLAGRAVTPIRLAAEVAALALVVAAVGFESTPAAGMVAVGSSVLSLNGFGLHELGELGWEPGVDLPAAAVLLCVFATAWSARERAPVPGPSSHRVPALAGRAHPEKGQA